jgi:hypothetical protein
MKANEPAAWIMHECRREAVETEAIISPARPARQDAPFHGILAGRTAR